MQIIIGERCLAASGLFGGKEDRVSEIVQGKYYLKTCIIVLRTAEQMPALMPLCRRLVESGIDCKALLSEEMAEPGMGCLPLLPVEAARRSGPETEQGVLFLTDDPEVYAALAATVPADSDVPQSDAMPAAPEMSACCQPPVLVYLHPGNRDADFGDARYALEEPEDLEPEYLERVYRRCHNLPWEILGTKRCWLRETVEEDVDSFWKMYQEAELTRYTEGLYPSPQAERKYIREYRRLVYCFYEFGVWTVLDRRSGAVVGRAGLSVREGYDLPELGFVIGMVVGWRRRCAGGYWNMPGNCWDLNGFRCWCIRRTPRPCICAESWAFGSSRCPRRQKNFRAYSKALRRMLVRPA